MRTNLMQKLIWTAAAACLAAIFTASPAMAGDDDRVRLRCSADGTQDISMDAKFEARNGRAKFDASFEAQPGLGFSAGQQLDVVVGGTLVGQMTLSDIGDIVGDLDFDTNVEANDNDVPLPGDFPAVGVGTSVVVGPLGCALQNN